MRKGIRRPGQGDVERRDLSRKEITKSETKLLRSSLSHVLHVGKEGELKKSWCWWRKEKIFFQTLTWDLEVCASPGMMMSKKAEHESEFCMTYSRKRFSETKRDEEKDTTDLMAPTDSRARAAMGRTFF